MKNDNISRQAAIDAVFSLCEDCDSGYCGSCRVNYPGEKDVIKVIRNLPSAQPEINCSEFPNNSDTISRQDAVSRRRLLSDLKELVAAWKKYPVMAEQIKGVEAAIGYVEAIPSAQPQTSMLTVECKLDDEELAKAIEEVKKANLELIAAEPHWIPCSEQLPPEENKTYWVCTDNGHQHECRWTNANPIWTHLTTDWHWNIFDIPQYTKVVAWMELPKPYDGGEQDG